MRTLERDQTGTVTLVAAFNDAASGAGSFTGTDIAYTWTRSSTGMYDFKFDPRVVPVVVVASAAFDDHTARAHTWSAGAITIATMASNVLANGSARFICTAWDKRQ